MPPSAIISSHFKEKRDVAHDYLKYWITVKGCPSLTQCHLYNKKRKIIQELTLQLFLKISALFLTHSSSSSDLLSRTGAENFLGVRSNEMLPKDLGGARPEIVAFSTATFLASSELKRPVVLVFDPRNVGFLLQNCCHS